MSKDLIHQGHSYSNFRDKATASVQEGVKTTKEKIKDGLAMAGGVLGSATALVISGWAMNTAHMYEKLSGLPEVEQAKVSGAILIGTAVIVAAGFASGYLGTKKLLG